jgi:membrane fusion protein (multidrug efflux system)
MPSEFRQTSIALRGDRERGRRALIALAAIPGLLVLAGLWLALARVPVYAVSQLARLEARDQVHPVDALVGGRVHRGDVLLTLDATDVRLRLDEARATEHGLTAQIAALEAEIAAREDALVSTRSLGEASLSEAQAARTETQAEAGLASRERVRADLMRQAGVVAEAEADRAGAAVAQADAAVHAREHRLSVLSSQTRRDVADRRAANDGLRRSLAALVAEHDAAAVAVHRLEVELDRPALRAPIDGVLGQVRAPQVGSVVAAGQTVAVVTPESALQVVADFAPASAIGRVRPGQRGDMRVAGFPWTQYGMLGATVAAVSGEVADGRIRVVLELDPHTASAIPRRHGVTGEVEIELDRVSPAVLIARAAGALFEPGEIEPSR